MGKVTDATSLRWRNIAVHRVVVASAAPPQKWAKPSVAADVLWVVGSVVLILVVDLPPAGSDLYLDEWIVAANGAQPGYLPARDDGRDGGVEKARVLTGTREQVWPLLTDHDLYGRSRWTPPNTRIR